MMQFYYSTRRAFFRQEGLPIKEALLKACPLKLRTIIMTNLTIIISMFPQTLGDRGVAVMRATLAGVEIGAIVVQTICTLTIIPVLYMLLDRFLFGSMVQILKCRHHRQRRV